MTCYPDNTDILNIVSQPAFSVKGGVIIQCNDAAQRILIQEGTSIHSLLGSNSAEYDQFIEGCLFLSLSSNGQTISSIVSRIGEVDIFILDPDNQHKELKTLSLTAANMRQPLSAMIATVHSIAPTIGESDNPKTREQFRQMDRNLHQMHRMLCNMSDALQYADGTSPYMMCQNIVSIVDEIFQKIKLLAQYKHISFNYTLPQEAILCSIDAQLLERGIYNMVSNAMKFTPEGGTVSASLIRKNHTLYISIHDSGCGVPPHILKNIFQRYQRQPGLEDSRYGLGLGLVMVRSAALVHGGTVLLDQPDGTGTRITMSIPIRQPDVPILRSSIQTIDYAGGWDHGLLELSDILPAKLYGNIP